MDDHLLGWLKTLDEERLARVLANRLDAIAPPWPRRLDTLAQRLGNGFAVMEVMRGDMFVASQDYFNAKQAYQKALEENLAELPPELRSLWFQNGAEAEDTA